MKPTLAVLYGDAGSAALIDAIKAWRRQYAPSAGYEGMFAEHLLQVETLTTVHHTQKATVVVTIHGKKRGTSDSYYYEATIVAGQLKLEKIV